MKVSKQQTEEINIKGWYKFSTQYTGTEQCHCQKKSTQSDESEQLSNTNLKETWTICQVKKKIKKGNLDNSSVPVLLFKLGLT